MVIGSDNSRPTSVTAIAFAAMTLAPLLSGCVGPGASTHQVLEGGSGYTSRLLFANESELLDVDLSPDRETIATIHADATLHLYALNGSLLATWTIPSCPYGGTCDVRFVDGGRILTVSGNQSRIWSPSGALLASPSLPGEEQGVVNAMVVRDGLEVVLGLYRYANNTTVFSSRVLDVNANLTTALPLGEGVVGRVTAASGDGNIVATSGSSVQFWRRPSDLLGEVGGMHEVAIDRQGSLVALRSTSPSQTTTPFGVNVVNLTTVPPHVSPLNTGNSHEGVPPHARSGLSMASTGRFVAFTEAVYLSQCGGFDCVVGIEFVTRIVDVDNPMTDRGFGMGSTFKVFLSDDGSAVAITCVLAPYCQNGTLTIASSNSTAPHATTVQGPS